MKTRNKALLALLCAASLVAGSVFGTYAYLTSTPDAVTNTFTVGKVEITLDEAKVNEYGEKLYKEDATEGSDPAGRVIENTYKLIPGHTYIKDPTVHVTSGSEECWVFVRVVNNLKNEAPENTIKADGSEYETIQEQLGKKWSPVTNETGVYTYKSKVDARTSAQDCSVFTEFMIDPSATSLTEGTLTVTAYAIQADGFTTAEEAWKEAPASWISGDNN